MEHENLNTPQKQKLHQTAVVGSVSDGFTFFDMFRYTSDEVEFRVKCKKCGMSAMDVENSCISCDCDWFQSRFNDYDEDVD